MAQFIPISFEEILKETSRFREWSGPSVIRLFESEGDKLYPLGSGGLLKFKDRFFVVTNNHVVRRVLKESRDIIIPYKDKNDQQKRASIIAENTDKIMIWPHYLLLR